MEKRYLDAAELLRDSWELARRVYASGWHPTHLVVCADLIFCR